VFCTRPGGREKGKKKEREKKSLSNSFDRRDSGFKMIDHPLGAKGTWGRSVLTFLEGGEERGAMVHLAIRLAGSTRKKKRTQPDDTCEKHATKQYEKNPSGVVRLAKKEREKRRRIEKEGGWERKKGRWSSIEWVLEKKKKKVVPHLVPSRVKGEEKKRKRNVCFNSRLRTTVEKIVVPANEKRKKSKGKLLL